MYTINEEDNQKQIYKREVKKRDLEITKMNLEEKELEVRVVREETKKVKAEQEKENTKKKTQEEQWDEEYKKFKKTSAYKEFDTIINILNFDNGNFYDDSYWVWNLLITKPAFSYIKASNIIKRNDIYKAGINLYIFTDKGNYFSKLYLDENLQ